MRVALLGPASLQRSATALQFHAETIARFSRFQERFSQAPEAEAVLEARRFAHNSFLALDSDVFRFTKLAQETLDDDGTHDARRSPRSLTP